MNTEEIARIVADQRAILRRTPRLMSMLDVVRWFGHGLRQGVGARIAQPKKPINKMRGLLRIHRRLPLLIAVPTTAGTEARSRLQR